MKQCLSNYGFMFLLEIRLVGNGLPYQGRLEVFYNGEWGTVCNDGWDSYDAKVACRQLNYPGVYTYFTHPYIYGPGSGPIHMTYLSCGGSETRLEYCPHRHNYRPCTHNEDVSVWCSTGKCCFTNNKYCPLKVSRTFQPLFILCNYNQ